MELTIFPTDFRKSRNINFHEIPSGRSRIFPSRRTDVQAQRHEESFGNFVNVHKKVCDTGGSWLYCVLCERGQLVRLCPL